MTILIGLAMMTAGIGVMLAFWLHGQRRRRFDRLASDFGLRRFDGETNGQLANRINLRIGLRRL